MSQTDARAEDVRGLVERARKLGSLCDPDCEGRCRVCPDTMIAELIDALEHLSNDAAAAIAANHALAILVRGLERLSTPHGNSEEDEKKK